MCVLTYAYINTHTHACIYFRKICNVYILNILYVYFFIYMLYVCAFIYIIYTVHTHILCEQKLFSKAINRLIELIINLCTVKKIYISKSLNNLLLR